MEQLLLLCLHYWQGLALLLAAWRATAFISFYFMKAPYNIFPEKIIQGKNREIAVFSTSGENIDEEVIKDFGEEWLKFQDYTDETIDKFVKEYFDILNETIVNSSSYAIDIGCGTGRWTKFLSTKAGFVEAIDPSNAIIAADNLLGNIENVRLSQAAVETIPFDDETFDFAMSIGVLHHIPDTQKAMSDCVKKIKKGGYFYCYLYYNLDNRGLLFKILFRITNLLRLTVSSLPARIKRVVCDILAAVIYLPMVLLVRLLAAVGFKKTAEKLPLSSYKNKSFFVLRNDALDRFGTKLEKRFSRKEVKEMMNKSGLTDIVISDQSPYWHAIGKKT
jgi:ubiquinone/menaquinone biosynthesis C-methylase UbiE